MSFKGIKCTCACGTINNYIPILLHGTVSEPPFFRKLHQSQIQIVFHLKILLISCFGIQSVSFCIGFTSKAKIFILCNFVAWNFFVNDFCEYAAHSTILKKLNFNALGEA
jgi:hypothetical protein